MALIRLMLAVSLLGGLGACASGSGSSAGDLDDADLGAPIKVQGRVLGGAPPKRMVQRAPRPRAVVSADKVQVWLYASLDSQAHLMKLGADPGSALRVWEYQLSTHRVPYARLSGAQALQGAPTTGVLLLPSTVALSEAERAAIVQWRNRGGSVLSTWWTGAFDTDGRRLGDAFMRSALDVGVAGDTAQQPADVFMVMHGDNPVAHTLPSGQRVWLERPPGQLPLRLTDAPAAAHITSWARLVDAQLADTLIAFGERRMPSGAWSRSVTLGFAEQNWRTADPKQLWAIANDVLTWLRRRPAAYAGTWPEPYGSATVLAIQVGEALIETDVELGQAYRKLGGTATYYLLGSVAKESARSVAALQAQGHEMGHFGDEFDGYSGQSADKQAARLDAMLAKFAQAGVRTAQPPSFAVPMDAYDATTRQVLRGRGYDSYLAYMELSDAALPLIDPAEPRGPVATVALQRILLGPENALAEWGDVEGIANFKRAWRQAVDMGSLVVLPMPSQALLTPAQHQELMDEFAALRGRSWLASARQVAQWWRDRSRVQVSLSPQGDDWVLSVNTEGTAPIQSTGLNVWVNLPQVGSRVRLSPLDGSGPAPVVVAQDALRARLRLPYWRPGEQRWLLQIEPAPTAPSPAPS